MSSAVSPKEKGVHLVQSEQYCQNHGQNTALMPAAQQRCSWHWRAPKPGAVHSALEGGADPLQGAASTWTTPAPSTATAQSKCRQVEPARLNRHGTFTFSKNSNPRWSLRVYRGWRLAFGQGRKALVAASLLLLQHYCCTFISHKRSQETWPRSVCVKWIKNGSSWFRKQLLCPTYSYPRWKKLSLSNVFFLHKL